MTDHKKNPPNDLTCACCWDDINTENYVEYKSDETSDWMTSLYCSVCIDHLLNTQWEIYVNTLAKTTCKAEQRRMLTKGPPINIGDQKALPCPNDGEVYKLWYMVSSEEKPQNFPIYVVHSDIDSFILFNDSASLSNNDIGTKKLLQEQNINKARSTHLFRNIL